MSAPPVATPRYREARVGGCLDVVVAHDADGNERLRSPEPLAPLIPRLTDRLEHWARVAPERTLIARRGPDGAWIGCSYAEVLERVRRVGQALVERGLSADRPVAILAENGIEHFVLTLAGQWVGVPVAPVSPAWALLSQDHAKLRHILGTVTPGLVFASSPAYARAIAAAVPPDVPVVLAQGTLAERASLPFAALEASPAGEGAARAHAATGPDTIAKFLFTSGSTRLPKAVITTQRMLVANQQGIAQCMPFLVDEPPVLVDWLPWNHVFGGSHNTGIAIYNGGTLHVDDGKPVPEAIGETLRNLREISPTIYFNVPKGFEEIARAMTRDEALRRGLFARCKALMFAGAGLSQTVWDALYRHAEASVGERVRMITGLGMTEAAPSCTFAVGTDVRSGDIGLPLPGLELKLVPDGDKREMRVRGPNVTPGYWRAPELTAEAFDDEGFYRTGDAVAWIDPAEPRRGLRFDGRIAEDFKLATGTFVSVGPLRARIVLEGDPCVQDVVLAGLNRDDVGALVFPRLDGCRRVAGLPDTAPASEVLAHPEVVAFFQALVDRLWAAGTGSASRIARLAVLETPPAIDRGELTDKGSINQRAVLAARGALVEALYAEPPGAAHGYFPAASRR